MLPQLLRGMQASPNNPRVPEFNSMGPLSMTMCIPLLKAHLDALDPSMLLRCDPHDSILMARGYVHSIRQKWTWGCIAEYYWTGKKCA